MLWLVEENVFDQAVKIDIETFKILEKMLLVKEMFTQLVMYITLISKRIMRWWLKIYVNNKHLMLIQKQINKLFFLKSRMGWEYNIFYIWRRKSNQSGFFAKNHKSIVHLLCFDIIITMTKYNSVNL